MSGLTRTHSISLTRLLAALLVHAALTQPYDESCEWCSSEVSFLQTELNKAHLNAADPALNVTLLDASRSERHVEGAAYHVPEAASRPERRTEGAASGARKEQVRGNASRPDDQRWCGWNREDGGRVPIYKDLKNGRLLLDLTDALKEGGVLRFVVTAMSIAGTYDDGVGYSAMYANPLETAENTMYEFRLSPDSNSVDVYRPIIGRRTSDAQMAIALRKGVGSGWLGDLTTLRCVSEGYAMAKASDASLSYSESVLHWPTDPPKETSDVDAHADLRLDRRRIVIDASDLLSRGFFVTSGVSGATKYRLLRAKTYPQNLDISATYSMGGATGPQAVGYSVVFLRETPMPARISDDRVLFFTTDYKDLGQHKLQSQEQTSEATDREVSMIWRYDLSAQPGRQIRIYVDPTVPVRWRDYFRQGIEAWNDAFVLATHSRTVRAVLPTDPDWPSDYDLSDARFSTISWSAYDAAVSMGIAKVDPRSGEIIKSDIIMSEAWVMAWFSEIDLLEPNLTFHFDSAKGYRFELRPPGGSRNTRDKHARMRLMELGSEGGFGLASLLSIRAGQPNRTVWQEDVIGQGLRAIAMHETGHILGLRHNFKGSLGVSFECTQNISCSAVHGLSSSIMDYVPLNYPGEGVDRVHAFSPVVGAYDKVAIRYGYTEVAGPQPEVDLHAAAELQQILVEAEDQPTCYDSDSGGEDPGCLPYDFTSEPLRFNREKLRHIAEVQKTLLDTVMRPGASYKRYGESARNLLYLAANTVWDGCRWIGGTSNNYVHRGTDGRQARRAASEPVPASAQREGLSLFLGILRPDRMGFLPPKEGLPYLVRGDSDDEVRSWSPSDDVVYLTSRFLSRVLNPTTIARLHAQEKLAAAASPQLPRFGVMDLLEGVASSVMADMQDPSDWSLQASFVRRLAALYADTTLPESVSSQLLLQIGRLDDLAADVLLRASGAVAANETGLLRAHLVRLRHQFSDAICAKDASNCVIKELDRRPQKSGSPHRLAPMALAPVLTGLALGCLWS